ncbi:MAG: transglycosylase SLT domain-containing protein [Streptosporangiaceae bacterium]
MIGTATAGLTLGLGTALPAEAAAPSAAGTVSRTTVTVKKAVKKKKLTRKQGNKVIARSLVKKRGWSKRQYRCLVLLWTKESNWNHRAGNGSGAYGIPQALPGGKMRSAGRDWRTNPKTQIKWGLRYIKSRYHTPCRAWSHSRATGWY